jgi:hypothetical protein
VFTPLNVNSDVPALVNATAPESAPLSTTGLNVVNVVADDIVPAPLNVNNPFLAASPMLTAPPTA